MTLHQHFARDYGDARRKFLDQAQAAGAALRRYENPATGPGGQALATDVAWIGPGDARKVLVMISGTHGAEGFCGSGVQVAWMAEGRQRDLPSDTALLMVHAINPSGFAWLRRVTEDNVDLNRNFVDFGQPLPVNADYDELHHVICPTEWNDEVIAQTNQILLAFAKEHGAMGLQRAIAGGQYSHPDGIFFGGQKPTWSRGTLEAVCDDFLGTARQIAVIDYHTGLGPYGHGERICAHAKDSAGLARAQDWYDGDVTCPELGTSTSSELFGHNQIGLERKLPGKALTCIALEYGTQEMEKVKLALRADNWLHLHGDLDSDKGRAIKQQIRDAFYCDADDWRQSVWDRAVETQNLALKALAAS